MNLHTMLELKDVDNPLEINIYMSLSIYSLKKIVLTSNWYISKLYQVAMSNRTFMELSLE